MPEGGRVTLARPSPLRLLVVGLLALLLAAQVVRTAFASHYVATRPDLAARAWPDHPRVALAAAMGEIGTAAAAGQAASPATLARAMAAARRGPLLTAPFLIKGAEALSRGDTAKAEALFREARRRDPRSGAARYFLAQHYLLSGRPVEGLAEAAVLTRLVAGGGTAMIPGLVQYAHQPGAVPHLREMFTANPELGARVLDVLAQDASNAALVVALAGDGAGDSKAPAPAWQAQLLASLIKSGDYRQARALWLRISGVRGGAPGLFNPQFEKLAAPAPFNWTLATGTFGVAEPLPPGKLQLIYYGRDPGEFASQLLMLVPGTYELRMQVKRVDSRREPSLLRWTLACQPGMAQLLDLPLAQAKAPSGELAGRFTVPANCPAQRLVLAAAAREFAAPEQIAIGNLQLVAGTR
jgi:hypothetical protein